MNELSEKVYCLCISVVTLQESQLVNVLEGETRDLVNHLIEMIKEKDDRKSTMDAENHTGNILILLCKWNRTCKP